MVVDHYSGIHKVVLMRSTSQNDTLDAKLSIEKIYHQHGQKINLGMQTMADMQKKTSEKPFVL